MKYTFIFCTSGTYLSIISLKFGVPGWLLLWLGISLVLVGIAYGLRTPTLLGKQSDGTMAWWAIGLLMPYLFLTWSLWHIQVLISPEECCHEIAPGIWLGRRAFANELPDNISLIVDLTAEFPEPRNAIIGKDYICVPTLDADVPAVMVFQELIDKISAWQGNIYIHCALGHGRSATVAAALLIAKGLADNANQAEAIIKKLRPGIEFTKAQRYLLKKVTKLA